jgi:uncharacterized protein
MDLRRLFKTDRPVIGMLHVPALPGSPANTEDFARIRRHVLRDAETLASEGVHGLIVENFGDAPFYRSRVPRYTIAFLTVLGSDVKAKIALPLGINVLRNDGLGALAIAAAAGAEFIRVNVYTGARVTDQGVMQGQAHRILRCRKLLGSGVKVFADVAVKHSAPLGIRDLADEVEDTVARGRADAVIVSGPATGKVTSLEDLRTAKAAAGATPVFAGSGVTAANAAEVLACADGIIVGTAFKKDGVTTNPVDRSRVKAFLASIR